MQLPKSSLITVFIFIVSGINIFAQSKTARVITVDVNKVKGTLNTSFKTCVGAGRANEGLRADWQQQLAIAHQACGFKYIRMHGLLTDDMAVYTEDWRTGKPQYNFQYVDALYDYILSIGMKPFVELGFMPSALASGNKTVFWWRGNVTPPKDYDKWAALIKTLALHFTERYGASEVKSWYFEVWNEPNLKDGFWTGTQEEYFKLYRYAAQAIKSVDQAYRVGGPATAGAGWVPEMIDYCQKSQTPIDFISTHAYGVKQGFLDEYGSSGTILSKDNNSVSGDMVNSYKQIKSSAKPNLELHYTEWSSSYTPADPIHDSYHSASYILEKVKQAQGYVNSMSYWVFTDIFEEPGPRFTPFHGGFGLMNIEGIKKPAFFAYSWLNHLGETELQNQDAASFACKNNQNSVQLLFWDYTYTLPDSTNNQSYYSTIAPAKSKGKAQVIIKGLAKGQYQLKIYQVGYRVNDSYTDYLLLGKPAQLTKEQVNQLKSHNNGDAMVTEKITINTSGGAWTRDIPFKENDVFLVELNRVTAH